MSNQSGGGKLPGKTKYAGRRRDMTRTSGFKVHGETTGGEFRRHAEKTYTLKSSESIKVVFRLSGHKVEDLLAYGMWFWHTPSIVLTVTGGPSTKRTLTEYGGSSWNKVGSMWTAENANPVKVTVTFTAKTKAQVALYNPTGGTIQHKHIDNARKELLPNMYQFAPEGIFLARDIAPNIHVEIPTTASSGEPHVLILKSCNRCGRYLPINVPSERDQLSFSNHCVAPHRRPCRHATFGRLHNIEDEADILNLDYGYQLECRFCKKFEVNAAHNPQRNSAQMKEDAARRRAFELLLAELYGGTPQLRYRHETGSELADDIWERFGRACFNCGTTLPSARAMHLDHTRPLALLWPLDGSATALCGPCNSEKRDRTPADFYTPEKLAALATITRIPIDELRSARPNEQALKLLFKKSDWFFGKFLAREEMTKERDGKITGELVIKALQKVLARSPRYRKVDLLLEYERLSARTR
jgi:hypothetical protein